MRALALAVLSLSALAIAARSPTSTAVAAVTGVVRVPSQALPLSLVWSGSFSGADAFGASLAPGPDHEAEGPSAVAAAGDGFAVLDALSGAVRFFDASGA